MIDRAAVRIKSALSGFSGIGLLMPLIAQVCIAVYLIVDIFGECGKEKPLLPYLTGWMILETIWVLLFAIAQLLIYIVYRKKIAAILISLFVFARLFAGWIIYSYFPAYEEIFDTIYPLPLDIVTLFLCCYPIATILRYGYLLFVLSMAGTGYFVASSPDIVCRFFSG